MSDPIVAVRLREVELDFILNAAPENDVETPTSQLLADYQRYVDTVLDLIENGVVE